MGARGILLSFLICTAGAAQVTAPEPVAYTSYRNDAMAFQFLYPSTFHRDKAAVPDPAKADDHCKRMAVGVTDMKQNFNLIFVMRYDAGCPGKDFSAQGLTHAASTLQQELLTEFGPGKMGASVGYELAGNHAALASGTVNVPHSTGPNVLFGVTSCVAKDGNMSCFQFLTNDCKKLPALAASSIVFDGGAAMSVIPAELVPACPA